MPLEPDAGREGAGSAFPTLEVPRAPAPLVSIIIPVKSRLQFLAGCLSSLARIGPSIPFETIVVLNDPDPGVEEELRLSAKGVEVVVSAANLGMAGSGNLGREHARGQFFVLLHDDAEVENEWLEALVATADAHPEAGAVGSKVLFPDGRLQVAGAILWKDGTTSLPWVGEPPEPSEFCQLRVVDYCGTSSLLVRADAWDAIGGLDERFYPAYYVDVDLSLALRRLGLVVLFQPRSRIKHHKGASSSKRFRTFVSERNRHLLLEKWGAALDVHELPQINSSDAIERALAAAEAYAKSLRPTRQRALGPTVKRSRFDPELQQRSHIEMSRALRSAYVHHLDELISNHLAVGRAQESR